MKAKMDQRKRASSDKAKAAGSRASSQDADIDQDDSSVDTPVSGKIPSVMLPPSPSLQTSRLARQQSQPYILHAVHLGPAMGSPHMSSRLGDRMEEDVRLLFLITEAGLPHVAAR